MYIVLHYASLFAILPNVSSECATHNSSAVDGNHSIPNSWKHFNATLIISYVVDIETRSVLASVAAYCLFFDVILASAVCEDN